MGGKAAGGRVAGGRAAGRRAAGGRVVGGRAAGGRVLRPLSNNTKASSQCVNCLIFIHTVTTALSDCLSEPLHMVVI